MQSVRTRLLRHAKDKCLPRLLADTRIGPWADRVAFILVGSVATGLCTDRSDIDVALVCDEDTYCHLSRSESWEKGRPTETAVDGVQLHYYGVTFDQIVGKVRDLDDGYLYVYGTSVVLRDSEAGHAHRLASFMSEECKYRASRVEGKLDMLMRRSRGLTQALADGPCDPLILGRLTIEVLTLILKVVALLDDVPFDPRKRLFATALTGSLGVKMRPDITNLLGTLGILSRVEDLPHCGTQLSRDVGALTEAIASSAAAQGFRIGLERPDHRHTEQ